MTTNFPVAQGLIDRLLYGVDMRAIAAMAANRVIGADNKIPWDIPQDMKFFRETTKNASVLMGRKTFESIGRPLANRTNVVLTRDKEWSHDGVITISDLKKLLTMPLPQPIWLCGGEKLYRQLLPACRELYLSLIFEPYEGDAKFPEFEDYFIKTKTILTYSTFETWHFINKKFS